MLNSRSNIYSGQPDSPQIRPTNSPTFPNSTLVDSIVTNNMINSQTNSRNPNARYEIRP